MCIFPHQNQREAVDQVIKAVRKICYTLGGVETPAITTSVKKLRRAVNLPRSKSPEVIHSANFFSDMYINRYNTFQTQIKGVNMMLTDSKEQYVARGKNLPLISKRGKK